MKKMSFSGKYIAKMFSLQRFLVSECDFKLACFCESCKAWFPPRRRAPSLSFVAGDKFGGNY